MVTAAALMLCVPSTPASAATKAGAWPQELWGSLFSDSRPKKRRAAVQSVPLPQPRPIEAPKAETKAEPKTAEPKTAEPTKSEPTKSEPTKPEPDKREAEKPAADATDKPAHQAASAPPPPSACRVALTEDIAIAPSIPDIKGAAGCGGEDLVRLEAVVLPDKRRIPVKPAAILRCAMASALVDWIRTDMAPLAASLGTGISELDNFDSYQCRGRNRIAGARLSEHGRANALDIRAIKLANGRSISLTDRTVARETRESVLNSMCARFPTVLGPGSDWYHEDHIHIDLAERRNNYRICQWDVLDPLPQTAPLLPAGRPPEAPPREVAATSEQGKSGQGKVDEAKPEAGKPEDSKPGQGKSEPRKPAQPKSDAVQPAASKASVAKSAPVAPATKKRRQDRRF